MAVVIENEDGIRKELSRFEKFLICSLIADESNRVERRLQKLHEKEKKGETTIFRIGEGRSDIHREWEREMRTMEALGRLNNIFGCGGNPDKIMTDNELKRLVEAL